MKKYMFLAVMCVMYVIDMALVTAALVCFFSGISKSDWVLVCIAVASAVICTIVAATAHHAIEYSSRRKENK